RIRPTCASPTGPRNAAQPCITNRLEVVGPKTWPLRSRKGQIAYQADLRHNTPFVSRPLRGCARMSIRIKARAGESAEQMLRRFKKMCEKEGLTKDVKRQAYYEKPSEKRRRAMRKSIKRVQQLGMPFVPRGGKMMGPPGRNGGGPNGPRGPMGRGPG